MYWCLCVYKIFYLKNNFNLILIMADVIAIVIGQMFCPFCCDTCATNFVHMWQMEMPLEGVKPLIDGWQMLPMWQVE